jgi:hypothetical protein
LFESEIPGAFVGRFSTETQTPSLEVWSDLLMNDIVMTPSDVSFALFYGGIFLKIVLN